VRIAVDTSVLLDVFSDSPKFVEASRALLIRALSDGSLVACEDGGSRTALVPDFLVAAHAAVRADRLLTRDRGFARRYFRRLRIVDPSH
jgi:predicted nucleic acid-binding protein